MIIITISARKLALQLPSQEIFILCAGLAINLVFFVIYYKIQQLKLISGPNAPAILVIAFTIFYSLENQTFWPVFYLINIITVFFPLTIGLREWLLPEKNNKKHKSIIRGRNEKTYFRFGICNCRRINRWIFQRNCGASKPNIRFDWAGTYSYFINRGDYSFFQLQGKIQPNKEREQLDKARG